MKNKHFNPRIGVGGVLVLTLVITLAWSAAFATPGAQAGETVFTPIWTAHAPDLNQSTAALMAGRHSRAIHFAEKANAVMPADRAVAAHNLCLAHLNLGATATAEAYCLAALRAGDATVMWKRGSATIGNPAAFTQDQAQDHGTASLRALMQTNIAQAYGRAAVKRITVANAAHPSP